MDSSEIRKLIEYRRNAASRDAEIVACTHEILAQSLAILQQSAVTTFLGEQHTPPKQKE